MRLEELLETPGYVSLESAEVAARITCLRCDCTHLVDSQAPVCEGGCRCVPGRTDEDAVELADKYERAAQSDYTRALKEAEACLHGVDSAG